jgi:bifunctional non-homologous end joining protein LigD
MTAPRPPSGPLWLHEVKHDGFRVIARKDGLRVRLYSRQGSDLANRFPRIVEAMARLPSCTLDGEAVACDDNGVTFIQSASASQARRPCVSICLRSD